MRGPLVLNKEWSLDSYFIIWCMEQLSRVGILLKPTWSNKENSKWSSPKNTKKVAHFVRLIGQWAKCTRSRTRIPGNCASPCPFFFPRKTRVTYLSSIKLQFWIWQLRRSYELSFTIPWHHQYFSKIKLKQILGSTFSILPNWG